MSIEIDLAAGDRRIDLGGRRPLHIADVGKAFRAQQFLDDELRGMTDRRGAHKAHRGGFQALLCGDCRRSEHPGSARQGKTGQKPASGLYHWHDELAPGVNPRHRRSSLCPRVDEKMAARVR